MITRYRLVVALGFAALLFLPIVALYTDNLFYVRFGTRILVFAIAAVSLDLVLGVGGMVSLGHALFVGVSAYAVAILGFHAANAEPLLTWPFVIGGSTQAWVVWPLALAITGLIALIIGAISLRVRGLYFIMITLAFGEMFYYFFNSLNVYGADEGLRLSRKSQIPLLNLGDRVTLYYVAFAVLIFTVWLCIRLTWSPFGLVIRAARQNERRVAAIGADIYVHQLTCFVIAGLLAGLSGILLVNNEAFVSPVDVGWLRSADLAIMVILGGAGSIFGAVFGSAVVLVAELLLSDLTSHWKLIWGPVLMLVVLFARTGLFGLLAGPGSDGHD